MRDCAVDWNDKTEDKDMLTIIKSFLKEKYNKPRNVYLGLVHRLDRPVGGVMVFAKTSKAAARLSEEVRARELKKSYLVVVDGKMEKEKDTLEDYLLKNEKNLIYFKIDNCLYQFVIKNTKDERENFLTTFHKTNIKQLNKDK